MLFYTCASGIYKELSEIYRYCVLRTYPSAKVIIDDYGDASACFRFLRDPEVDYVHVTDIDILILPHKMSHEHYYTSHAHMGASYVRGCKKGRGRRWVGDFSRICGGEVGFLPEYYKRTELIREKWARKVRNAKYRELDEVMLFRILKESGYTIPDKTYHFPDGTPWSRTYRDLHINDFRGKKYRKWQPDKRKVGELLKDIPQSLLKDLSSYWTDLFDKIHSYAFS